MVRNPLSMDWQKSTRKDLTAAGWYEVYDGDANRSWWGHPNFPGQQYTFEGAKYTQAVYAG